MVGGSLYGARMAPSAPRLARQHDVPALEHLTRAAYAKYVPRIGFEPPQMAIDLPARVARAAVHVLEAGGEPAAAVVSDPRVEEGSLWIAMLAVHPAHEHCGLGRALLSFVEARCRMLGLHKIELFVGEEMWEVIAWLARLGYRQTDRREQDGVRYAYLRKDIGSAGF